MEAFTSYVLYCENGFSGSFTGSVDVANLPDGSFVKTGYLNGAIVPQTINAGYVLQNQGEGMKFYQIREGDTFNIQPGKCWLSFEGEPKMLNIKIDETTGVESLVHPVSSALQYDLSGRQRQHVEKGIVIMNGKKILK